MSIKVKILLLILSSLVIVLLVSTYYNERSYQKNAETNLMNEVTGTVRLVDAEAVTNGNVANLDELNEDLGELVVVKPDIVRIDLFTLRGKRLSPWTTSVNPAKASVPRTPLKQEDIGEAGSGRILFNIERMDKVNYVNIVAPVHLNGSVIGLAEVKISRKDFDNVLWIQRELAFFTAVLAIILITVILTVSMNRLVYDPIHKLLHVISRVNGGDLSASAPPGRNDEIGLLTDNFNGMIRTLKSSAEEKEYLMRKINSFNEGLRSEIDAATRELQKRNENLEKANRSIYSMQKKLGHTRRLAAVGQMAASLAHELGTPLHSVSGHLQILLEEPGLSPDIRRRLAIMHSQLERVVESIHHTLDTTRPPEESYDPVDLNKALQDIRILVLPETLSKGITVEEYLEAGLPAVHGISSQLQEVFLNLMDNAIDASRRGGTITVSTRIIPEPVEVRAIGGAGAACAEVAIRDFGCGIPEDAARIFEPFYTTKPRGEGTGLGLAISKEIISRHQGAIKAERLKDGSRFTVLLPLREERQ